jgi:hypothetical protein
LPFCNIAVLSGIADEGGNRESLAGAPAHRGRYIYRKFSGLRMAVAANFKIARVIEYETRIQLVLKKGGPGIRPPRAQKYEICVGFEISELEFSG